MIRRVCCLIVLAVVFAGCGSDSVTEPENMPPSISLQTTKLVAAKQTPFVITVDVSDPDVDAQLTTTWAITRGTLSGTELERRTWTPPATLGTDTLVVTVSDGTATTTIREEFLVGTLFARSIIGSWNFSKAESPWVVSLPGNPPRLEITGDQVTAEAGAQLYIDTPGGVIDVTGTFTCNGTVNDMVMIIPNDRNLSCGTARGWWEGLTGTTDNVTFGDIMLAYTRLGYGANNIRLREASTATLTNCIIECAGGANILMEGSGSLTVTACNINRSGNTGIEHSSFSSRPASIIVTDCVIESNDGSGIRLDYPDPNHSSTVSITGNRIWRNRTNGILLDTSAWPSIHNNHISRNNSGIGSISNIRMAANYPENAPNSDTMDCTNNYWGAPYGPGEQSTIESTIWDSAKVSSVGTRVNVNPWLTTDPSPQP